MGQSPYAISTSSRRCRSQWLVEVERPNVGYVAEFPNAIQVMSSNTRLGPASPFLRGRGRLNVSGCLLPSIANE